MNCELTNAQQLILEVALKYEQNSGVNNYSF